MRHEGKAAQYITPPAVLEAMLSHLADFAYLFDLEGRFVYANRSLLDLLGLSLEEIIGKNFHDLQYPKELALRLQNQIKQVISTGLPMRDETPFTGVNGEPEHYEYLFTPVFDRNGTIEMVAGTTRNITSRIQTERRLNATLIAGEIGTWIFEITTNRVFADRNLARLFGVSEKDANGGPLEAYLKAIHPEDIGRVQVTIGKAIADESEFESQYRLVTPTGVRSILARGKVERNSNGMAVRLPGVVLDLTNQHYAEAELIKAQDRLGIAVEAAELGTFSLSIPFAKVVWNDKCREHFWVSQDSPLTFDQVIDLLHREDRERVRNALLETVETGSSFDSEHRTVSSKGEIRWVHAIGRCVHDGAGRPVRLDGITMDVTSRRLLEESREAALAAERAARAEAERVGRMKDEFLATLSHELRTPLSAILGWTQILRTGKQQEEEIRNGLQVIERNTKMQAKLIEDLLDMSRIISGKVSLDIQKVDLHEVVQASVNSVRHSAEAKEIELHLLLDTHPAWVRGDSGRLQQCFWNLLSNAIKFTPNGGMIQVSVERVKSHFEVSVADNGKGIETKFLSQVFERFRQGDASTTRQHGGLGLGLSIVKHLIELHGGAVRATSGGKGKGATFSIEIPILIAFIPEAEPSETPRSDLITESAEFKFPTLKGVTVLVVDDEADTREILKNVLEKCAVRVLLGASAREGMAILIHEHPDVIISDIGMPKEDGYEFIRQVRRLPPEKGGEIPAAALTAFARAEDRTRALQAGYQTHMAKPVELAELTAVIARLSGRSN